MSAFLMSAMPGDDTITREGATTIVNTTTIGKSIEGYAGPTPLKIYIEKDKVVKVETLRSQEGPKYMAKAKKLLEKYPAQVGRKGQEAEGGCRHGCHAHEQCADEECPERSRILREE